LLKKSITFEDLNGQEVTEDHFFHLSKADLVEMELSQEGGLSKKLEEVVESGDGKSIIETFKKLVLDAYGKKSDDGRRFIKTPELRAEFEGSEAYSALFMELVTNADAAAEFVNGIVPRGMEQDVEKLRQVGEDRRHPSDPAAKPVEPPMARPAQGGPGVPRVINPDEAREMEQSELSRLLASGEAILGNSREG
jgi:hypothetical protein